jgi:hypothetical protein
MYPAPDHVASHRFVRLAPKLADKAYRDSYVSTQLRIWLADQVRALRGDMTQAEFGKLIGKPQAVVSRLEDPDYGRLTLEPLLELASKLDIALLVRFVDHATFLMATNDFSDNALRPTPYNQATINALTVQSVELSQTGQLGIGFTGIASVSISTGNTIYYQHAGGVGLNVPGNFSGSVLEWHSVANTQANPSSAAAIPDWSRGRGLIAISDERETSHG